MEATIISEEKKIFKFKICLFGSPGVGKTSLILRYIKESFSEDLKKTIGTNFLIKEVEIDNLICRLLIWDIGGQSQFSSLRQVYFKGSQAAIGVYDITSPESLHRILDWVNSIKKSVGSIPMILVGNKIDIEKERRIPREDALDLAARLECPHYEASAKMGDNVEKFFLDITKKCLEIAKTYENVQ